MDNNKATVKVLPGSLEVEVPVHFVVLESGLHVAVCKTLKLTTHGKDLADVTKASDEMLDAFFLSVMKNGELDKVLKSLGWTERTTETSTTKKTDFDVLADMSRQAFRHPARVQPTKRRLACGV